jgi:hypothetical protein
MLKEEVTGCSIPRRDLIIFLFENWIRHKKILIQEAIMRKRTPGQN